MCEYWNDVVLCNRFPGGLKVAALILMEVKKLGVVQILEGGAFSMSESTLE